MLQLPFTHEQFLQVFAGYNTAVWPAQWVAYALGIAAVAAAHFRAGAARWLVPLALAAMWLWTGVMYHWMHFSAINRAAFAFGALFVLQALLFVLVAFRGGLAWSPVRSAAAPWSWLLIVYALVVYPALGIALGQAYPALPTFGITPCPVTIFTFGLLLQASRRVPVWLLVIPVLWALVGGSAALLLRVPQDWVLLLSALAVLPVLMANRRYPKAGRALPHASRVGVQR